MMTRVYILIVGLCVWTATVWAQGLPGGSNGSDGPLSITSDTTLNVPVDGIFNATTITVAAGVMVTFNRNAANTPIFLLATGDIAIAGTIDVSGENSTGFAGGVGGPGGFDGGAPGLSGSTPGDGFGPGAGAGANSSDPAGRGAYGADLTLNVNATDGTAYGSPLLIPLVGGSGGGGGGSDNVGGGGGGGAILLASDTLVDISGAITARGETAGTSSFNAPGSGGAIRIVAPRITGAGTLDVRGGGSCTDGCGGRGRIRLDLMNRPELALTPMPSSATSIGGLLFVLPDVLPRLDILAVAGQTITESATEPVQVLLPSGSPTNQTVIVQARDFTGIVLINVVVTPDSGTRRLVEATIDMSTSNPATVAVTVTIPVNVLTHINAWTR